MSNASAMPGTLSQQIRNGLARTDIFLLVFLLTFTVDSVVIKPIALVCALVFLWRSIPQFKFKDAPLFYVLIPAMEIIRFSFFNHDFSSAHAISFTIGICYWLMAFFAFLIVRYRAEKYGAEGIAGTLTTWFFINAGVSFFHLVMTMVHSGTINPYASHNLTFGSSTGDFIKGAMLAPSYINMFVNAFFTVWFLYRKEWGRAMLAALICCLTTTNFANIIFLPILLVLFFVLKEKKARYTIAGCFGIFIFFILIISTANFSYLKESVRDNQEIYLTPSIKADTAGKVVNKDSISRATRHLQDVYGQFARPNGKFLSWKQTLAYAVSSPTHALFGAGIGNFSSLLALQTAHIYGRKHSRFYEYVPTYIHPDYYPNHYMIMKNVYSLPEGYHSARHMPHSLPNQLLGEYGLVGCLFFLFFYLGYLLKRQAAKGFFLFVMLLTGGFLWFDYLFEYLSVMVFFELFFWMHRATLSQTVKHA